MSQPFATETAIITNAKRPRQKRYLSRPKCLISVGGELEADSSLSDHDFQKVSILDVRDGTQIFVRTLAGNIITLEVKSSESIEKAKQKIQDNKGLFQGQYGLYFAGKELKHGHSLSDYNTQKESTFYFSGDMQIFVKTLTGRTIAVKSNSSDSIENLKQTIQEIENISPGQQRPFIASMQLEDNRSLSNYNIHDSNNRLVLHHRICIE